MIHLCGSGFGQNGSTRYVGGACARDNGTASRIPVAQITTVTARTFTSCILLPRGRGNQLARPTLSRDAGGLEAS